MRPSEWGEEGQFESLMASQQRQLRKLIENQIELDEDDFLLTMGDGRWAGFLSYVEVPVIRYEPEEFFFSVLHLDPSSDGMNHFPGGHAVYFRPGNHTMEERHMQIAWPDVRRYFGDWLGYIARELDLHDNPDLEDDDVEEDDADDEPEQENEWDVEYEDDAEKAPAPRVVASPEPDPPVAAEVVVPPTPPQPSRFQRLADWVKTEKNERGALWGLVAFLVTVVLALIALL